MLKRIIAFSIRHPGLVLGSALILVGLTLWQLPRMPVDVFPELNAPTVVVMTEAPGLDTLEVEQFVTFPIESAVNGLPGVRRVRSTSALSLSIVYVEFGWGMDIFRARQLVSERLDSVRENLPESVHAEISPVSSVTGEIMLVSLSSPEGTVPPTELRAFAEYDLRNRLLAVPGVTQVVVIGGELPEYQINVHSDRLALYNLTAEDVKEAARRAHTIASAGYLADVEGQELPLRQTGRVRSVEDIRSTIVRYHRGVPVTIGQVADVVLAGAPRRGTASESGVPAVVLSIQKVPGANTLSLTEAVDQVLRHAEGALPEGARLNRHVFRQSDFISLSVNNVIKVSRDAAILVTVILILFLLNVRTTLITLTALPLSLAAALLVMWAAGLSINVMTLGGLAVAIGELVDDAIIDVENVFRRLKENAALPEGQRRGRLQVIYDASNEIRSSVVFATLIIIIVFVPLLFLQGLEGRFFRPLGIAYITSILASLVVALTVTPAMCRLLLRGRPGRGGEGGHDGPLVRALKHLYRPGLELALRWRRTVAGAAAAATVGALLLASTFGTSFLPEFNEGTFTVFVFAPRGTSLAESDRMTHGIEKRLAEIEGVRTVVRRTGRAELDEHAEPVSNSEIEVTVKPGYGREAIRRQIDAILDDVPGLTTSIGQPIEHRLSHILSGTPAAIAISVFGDDLVRLRRIAREMEEALRRIPGARDVTANRELLNDSVSIDYRPHDLARYGLTPAEAAEQVQVAFAGETVARINDGVRRYDMVVRMAPEERQNVQQLRDLVLRGREGAQVRLTEVADVTVERTPNQIVRENARRKALVSLNVDEGANLGDLVQAVRREVDPIVARYGYAVEYGGQFEAQQSASRTIYWMGLGVILFIGLLLHMALGSARAALLVMVNLPLALIGGVLAIYLTAPASVAGNTRALLGLGGAYTAPVISIASMVGFVTLFGIAVRNGILLVNHYRHLMQVEGRSLTEAVVQGSMERLVPILMTALSAVLGLIPLALAAGEPGSELLAPLAVVVLGGLITSTFLNLFVVPAGYLLFFHGRPLPWRTPGDPQEELSCGPAKESELFPEEPGQASPEQNAVQTITS